MKSDNSVKRPWVWTFLTGLVLVGLGMRVFRLTHWSLVHDEQFTLRDSLRGGELGLRPKNLLFILNHYLVSPFLELDEFGLRLLPLVFGVAGIVAVWYFGSKVLGSRAGLFAAVLVTFAPWHLYWSQNARYQSLLFLLSAGVPVAMYLGIKEEKLRWFVLAGVLAVLDVLAHPSGAFVVAGAVAWMAGHLSLTAFHGGAASRRVLAVATALLLLFAVVSVTLLGPTLVDRSREGITWGIAGPFLLMSHVNWLTPGVVLFAAGGVLWLWRDDSRDLAVLLVAAVGVPFVALALLGYVLPVSVGYLFPTAPFVLMAAGYFLARLTDLGTDRLGRTLIGATCTLTLMAGGLTAILSHYMNGGRPDVRSVGAHLEARARPGDLVVGDGTVDLRYYFSAGPVATFRRDPAQLDSTLTEVARATPGGRLWIVAYFLGRAGLAEQGLGSARPWVRQHCEQDTVIGHPRLDYKVDDLHVYRCDSDGPVATQGSVP